MGFDAHIAALFEKSPGRGLWGYIKLIFKEFFAYKGETYNIKLNGKEINKKAFILACCNSGQYGNDFYIAPTASMIDGRITVSIIKPFYWILAPYILLKVILRKVNTLSIIETYDTQELKITRTKPGYVHIDGEPMEAGTEINLSVKPLALEIICK